jgi:hypothetical protein
MIGDHARGHWLNFTWVDRKAGPFFGKSQLLSICVSALCPVWVTSWKLEIERRVRYKWNVIDRAFFFVANWNTDSLVLVCVRRAHYVAGRTFISQDLRAFGHFEVVVGWSSTDVFTKRIDLFYGRFGGNIFTIFVVTTVRVILDTSSEFVISLDEWTSVHSAASFATINSTSPSANKNICLSDTWTILNDNVFQEGFLPILEYLFHGWEIKSTEILSLHN